MNSIPAKHAGLAFVISLTCWACSDGDGRPVSDADALVDIEVMSGVSVQPAELEIGISPEAEPASTVFTLTNLGWRPVRILTLVAPDGVSILNLFEGDELTAGQSIEVRLQIVAEATTGPLRIWTDGGLAEVFISIFEPTPHLVATSRVDFARVDIGSAHSLPLIVENDGTGAVALDGIRMPLETSIALLEFAPGAVLGAGESFEFEVRFAPEVPTWLEDQIQIFPAEGPTLEVDLAGWAGPDGCSDVELATDCAVAPPSEVAPPDAVVGDTIECHATFLSECPAALQWHLSSSSFLDSPAPQHQTGRAASFEVPRLRHASDFRIVTESVSPDGGRGPSTDFALTASSRTEGIDMDARWQSERATDIDVHLLHPNGCWNSRWDCTPRTGCTTWFSAREDGNPYMSLDSTESGPERAEVWAPDSIEYSLAVDNLSRTESATVTVTVRLAGRARYRETRVLEPLQWWVVGTLRGDSNEVVASGETFDEVPACE